jgi:hypothetical protein
MPGGSTGAVKNPSPSVVVCRFNPVAPFKRVMLTSGTTAPPLSRTVPLSVAVLVCAWAVEYHPPKRPRIIIPDEIITQDDLRYLSNFRS